jgi:glycosyltransferase involved in cell wall biosynthesis
MPTEPTVSVLMPVRNAQRYLKEAVESVLGQTYEDFEFLIIDDGSTDRSLRILKRYAARQPRIRLTSRPNKGIAATLNELIDQARGEFIARMDADDVSLPERFQHQADYLRAHPECVLVGCRVWHCDAEGDPLHEYPTLGDHEAIDAFHFQMRGPALMHPSIMMRRDAVLAVGKYRDFAMSEEVDLYLRLAEHGQLVRLPQFLINYRIHDCNHSFNPCMREVSYRANCTIIPDACRRRNIPLVPLPALSDFLTITTPGPEIPPAMRDRVRGWQGLGSGHVRTARKYARRVVAKAPFSIESWRLMYCAIRGY